MCTPDNGELHADTKNGSARSSSQIQVNVVLREVWHSTQSTIMSDPDQDSSLPCRDKVVYWHPQWIQISGPEWSPPKLRVGMWVTCAVGMFVTFPWWLKNVKSRSKIACFSNERHIEIWLPKKKTITCFWVNYLNYTNKTQFCMWQLHFP